MVRQCRRLRSQFYARKTWVWISYSLNKLQAKNIAKSKLLLGYKKKHKDDIASLETLISSDDCELITKIDNWEILLTPYKNFIEENNYPYWYGY